MKMNDKLTFYAIFKIFWTNIINLLIPIQSITSLTGTVCTYAATQNEGQKLGMFSARAPVLCIQYGVNGMSTNALCELYIEICTFINLL